MANIKSMERRIVILQQALAIATKTLEWYREDAWMWDSTWSPGGEDRCWKGASEELLADLGEKARTALREIEVALKEMDAEGHDE